MTRRTALDGEHECSPGPTPPKALLGDKNDDSEPTLPLGSEDALLSIVVCGCWSMSRL